MAPNLRFVTRKWAPAVGGMETYCLKLVERLREHRELDLIALPGRADGRAPSSASLIGFGLITFLRLLTARPVEIVHISDMASWPLGWAAALRSHKTGIVISAHGSDLSYAEREGIKAKLYRAYLALGARILPRVYVIANSNWIADLARKAGFVHVSTVRMGSDFAVPKNLRSTNGSLLFAGRIAKGKGLRFLIEDVLPQLESSPRLRVAGTVWDEEEAQLLTNPNVDYLGTLPPTELAREYAAATVVLIPSRLPEGFGLVATEAAACGGVVLAANHSGLAEAVTDNTGFLVAPEDAKQWAAKIKEIKAWSDKRRQSFIDTSKTASLQLNSWNRATEETLAVYAKLAEGRV